MSSIERFADPAVMFWIAVAVICVVPSISWAWVAAKKSKYENELKRAMIEQGMSAEDIERVLGAGSSGDSEKERGS